MYNFCQRPGLVTESPTPKCVQGLRFGEPFECGQILPLRTEINVGRRVGQSFDVAKVGSGMQGNCCLREKG